LSTLLLLLLLLLPLHLHLPSLELLLLGTYRWRQLLECRSRRSELG
jgi:hypothetical protein